MLCSHEWYFSIHICCLSETFNWKILKTGLLSSLPLSLQLPNRALQQLELNCASRHFDPRANAVIQENPTRLGYNLRSFKLICVKPWPDCYDSVNRIMWKLFWIMPDFIKFKHLAHDILHGAQDAGALCMGERPFVSKFEVKVAILLMEISDQFTARHSRFPQQEKILKINHVNFGDTNCLRKLTNMSKDRLQRLDTVFQESTKEACRTGYTSCSSTRLCNITCLISNVPFQLIILGFIASEERQEMFTLTEEFLSGRIRSSSCVSKICQTGFSTHLHATQELRQVAMIVCKSRASSSIFFVEFQSYRPPHTAHLFLSQNIEGPQERNACWIWLFETLSKEIRNWTHNQNQLERNAAGKVLIILFVHVCTKFAISWYNYRFYHVNFSWLQRWSSWGPISLRQTSWTGYGTKVTLHLRSCKN